MAKTSGIVVHRLEVDRIGDCFFKLNTQWQQSRKDLTQIGVIWLLFLLNNSNATLSHRTIVQGYCAGLLKACGTSKAETTHPFDSIIQLTKYRTKLFTLWFYIVGNISIFTLVRYSRVGILLVLFFSRFHHDGMHFGGPRHAICWLVINYRNGT